MAVKDYFEQALSFLGWTANVPNNTSTSGKSTVIRATIDSTTKDITISQSAGAKVYGNWSAWTVNISADITFAEDWANVFFDVWQVYS